MKRQFDPNHVLAWRRPDLASGAACVTVEVSSGDLFDGKKFEIRISEAALPNRFPSHVLAWAAGYYVIQMLRDAQLVPDDQLWIGSRAHELEERIDDACRDSEAHWAALCPQTGCQETVVLPNSQILLNQPPPSENFDAILACGKEHSLRATESDLYVYIKALPPLLQRGTAVTEHG